MYMKENHPLPMLTGDFSGYGCMHLYILNSRETYWWILPYVNTQLFSRVLADFGQEFGLGKNKRILLAVDQAGWHKA